MKRLNSIGVFESLAILGMVAVAVVCAVKKSFFFSGTVLGASIIAYILAFFVASYGLKRQGMGLGRIFYAVASVASARWFFEIFYHYAFPVSFATVLKSLSYISTNISENNFPLIWSLVMVMVIFTGYKYMVVGKWFWITLAVSAMSFMFWLWIGYPQWVHPEQWPVRHPLIYLIPRAYAHAPDEAAKNFISMTSLVINSISKIAVCALLPTLFWKK